MGYVVAGYGITIGTLVAYAAWVLARGRKLKR
jgi:heme exporter protein CcmD